VEWRFSMPNSALFDEAARWLDRAAAIATSAPTPLRARELATWRGIDCAEAGDIEGFRRHFQAAIALAADQGKPAQRCETWCNFAVQAARLGVSMDDASLITEAEQAALEVQG